MFESVHKYWSSLLDKYIRPKGLRAGLARSLRVTASAVYGAESLSNTGMRFASRKAFQSVSIPVNNIQQVAPIAGYANNAELIAGHAADSTFKYCVSGLPEGITTFASSVASDKVLLRGCDFIEKEHLYLFKVHPGKYATRVPTNNGDFYVLTTTGSTCSIRHSVESCVTGKTTSSFARSCLKAASAVYQRAISIPAQVLTAITKNVVLFGDAAIQCSWEENNKRYSCTDTGVLYVTDKDVKQLIGTHDKAIAGETLYKHNTDVLVVPVKNKYVIILTDIVNEDEYPEVAELYADAFVAGSTTKDALRSFANKKGCFSEEAREQLSDDIKTLDRVILQVSGKLVVQVLSL